MIKLPLCCKNITLRDERLPIKARGEDVVLKQEADARHFKAEKDWRR